MPITITGTGNITTGGSPSISLPSSGIVLTPQHRYGFLAVRTSNQNVNTTGAVFVFDTFVYNVGNLYNNTTGVVTVPETGMYLFMLNALSANDGSTLDLRVHVNGTNTKLSGYAGNWSGHKRVAMTFTYLMNKNDTLDFRSNAGAGTLYGDTATYHSFLNVFFLG